MIMESRRTEIKELANGQKCCHYCQGGIEKGAKHHVYLENSCNGEESKGGPKEKEAVQIEEGSKRGVL